MNWHSLQIICLDTMKIDDTRTSLLDSLTICAAKPTTSQETQQRETNSNLENHPVKCQVSEDSK